MKSKMYLFGLALVITCSFGACKPKQSAYQHVYEAAQSRSTVYDDRQATSSNRNTGSEKAQPSTETFQPEKITPVDGMGIKQYSVVIGSFLNKTNAESLKSRMQNKGYRPVLAQNEKGMYRVIVATFDYKTDAQTERNTIRNQYSEFKDAWLLERMY